MSASQRPTRQKSARKATFDDEEVRPVKRTKTTADTATVETSKQTNGRKSAGTKKTKTPAAYDEDIDGLQFTRVKTRRQTAKDAQPAATTETSASAPPPAPVEEQSAPRPTKKKRQKPAESAPPAAPIQADAAPQRRRSTRNSGGVVQQPPPEKHDNRASPPAPTPTSATAPTLRKRRERTPADAEPQIHVEKKREPSKIPLPFADTPVITRNKEMRKHSAEGHRRSSSSMRGRRASSLIESGTSNAMPHSEVQTEDFYKHINQDLPEPRRMQQLLSWCGTRALPPKPAGGIGEINAVQAARVVQEELLRDFSKRSELSDWFNREDTTPVALVKKPNPRNVQNAAKLEELEREVQRLTEEKQAWRGVLSTLRASTSNHGKAVKELAATGPETLQPTRLQDSEQETILSNLISHRNTADEISSRLKQATTSLEFKLDIVANGVHKLQKLKETADGVIDAVLSNASSALEERDQAAIRKAGMEKVGVGDILRSLSRA